MKTVTLSLPDSLAMQLEQDVALHGYQGIGEYLTEVLRRQQCEQEVLTDLLLEGLRSGDPIPATPRFWAELHEDTDAMIAKHRMDQERVSAA